MSIFTFKEASPELWKDLENLFGENGACAGCWCQFWRVPKGGRAWEIAQGEYAQKAMRSLFKTGEITGLLAFDDKKAVGWCSYGPRTDFPRTETMKAYRRNDIEKIWSINCFFIDKKYRKKGLAREMLKAALNYLKKSKVKIVEGYPVPLTKAGEKLPPAFSYTGPLTIFEEAGFEIIQRLSFSRPLVQKTLRK